MKRITVIIAIFVIVPSVSTAALFKMEIGPNQDTVTYDTATGTYWAPIVQIPYAMTYDETLSYINSTYNAAGYAGLGTWDIAYDENVYKFRSHMLENYGHEFDNFDPVTTDYFSDGSYRHYVDAMALVFQHQIDYEYFYVRDIYLGVEYYDGGCFRDYGSGTDLDLEYWIHNPILANLWVCAVPEPHYSWLLFISIFLALIATKCFCQRRP